MTPLESTEAQAQGGDAENAPRLYTWISEAGRTIEQVRIVERGDRMRAKGTIIGADDEHHPAFTLAYEAEVDSTRSLRRVSLTTTSEQVVNQLDLVRDSDGEWLMDDRTGARTRVGNSGVVDLDITFSVFFASLIIRRHSLHSQRTEVEESVLSISATSLSVREDSVTFTSDESHVHGITQTASTSATVDSDGMIVDIPGLTKRA